MNVFPSLPDSKRKLVHGLLATALLAVWAAVAVQIYIDLGSLEDAVRQEDSETILVFEGSAGVRLPFSGDFPDPFMAERSELHTEPSGVDEEVWVEDHWQPDQYRPDPPRLQLLGIVSGTVLMALGDEDPVLVRELDQIGDIEIEIVQRDHIVIQTGGVHYTYVLPPFEAEASGMSGN